MHRCSVLWLVVAGCYRPTDLAHCAITCDPFANNCPGELVCGTDSFCHGPGEAIAGCVPEMVDALRGPDAFIIRHDAGPDALPDGGSSCVHAWTADFSSDPTAAATVDRWQTSSGGGFPTTQLLPMGAPTYWAATANESLVTNGSSAFATATTIDVTMHPIDQHAAIQLNLNTTTSKSTQLTLTVEATGATQAVTLTNSSTVTPLATLSVTDAFHRYQLGVKPNGGPIFVTIDGTAMYTSQTYDTSTGGIIGGVTLIATGRTDFDTADVCAQ